MPGSVRVGRPNRIRHIPLSWDVTKARSNHEPKFRPVGDAILRGRERSVGQVMEEMFAAMPPVEPIIAGEMDVAAYLAGAMEVAEPYRVRIAEILQPTFNEGALLGQDRIRADMNDQLRRLGSPLRLTDADGDVTKATANPQTVGGVRVGMSPKAEWAAVGVEAFDSVDAASVQYAQFRSGTLVTAMVEEQQRVIQSVIGESFTAQQTFQTGRTVTGLTAQQTSQALVTVLQDVNPTTSVGQNLARFRSVNMNGLTQPWERAVYHRAERMADALAKQGVTGVKAQMKVQKSAQRHADKLRRSRARMISRTEIKNAQVQGQLTSMRQAVSDGLADPATAGKQWVTGATDVCNICSDLGFSKAIPLDQSFEGGFDGPTAHPNCRCDVAFVHTLSQAPKAHGAAGPNSPYRPGTPENPIVWEFPSGFRTQPSATRAFTPPGFVPPVPPPAAVTPPAQPSAPVEVPVRPAETLPSSNAEIVWDDAGRKWAQLTDDERGFLLDSHVDDLLRQAYGDVTGVLSAEFNPVVTRPPLPDDAPDAVKAIFRQVDRVDELKAKQAIHDFGDDLLQGKGVMEGEFAPTNFRDHFYGWADDSVEGYVSGQSNASFIRVKEAAEEGTRIPGSTRRLVVKELDDLIDPDGAISNKRLHRAMKRVFVEEESVLPNVIAELEVEMTKLGTMVRTEAQERAALTAPPDSWVARKTATKADVEELYREALAEIRVVDESILGLREEMGRLPSRNRALSVKTELDGVIHDAVHQPYERALKDFVTKELEAAGGGSPEAVAAGQRGGNLFSSALYDAPRLDDAAGEAMRQILKGYDDLIQRGLMTPEEALARVDPLRSGPKMPGGPSDSVSRRFGDYLVEVSDDALEEARTILGSAPVDEFGDWVDDVVERFAESLETFWGSQTRYGAAIAEHEGYIAVQQEVIELVKALHAGLDGDEMAVLIGRWSRVGTGGDLRSAINEVLREVRMIGGETFTYETGLTVHGRTGFQTTKMPHVQKALDEMEEAVDEWMPTDWITRSNERGNIGFYEKAGDSRAHYVDGANRGTGPGDGLINIGSTRFDVDQSTMLHEITHRTQRAVPVHSDLERQFVVRRVAESPETKQAVRRLDEIHPGRDFESYEIAVEDEFIDAYIGKIYDAKTVEAGRLSEVTPVAIQELSGLPGFSGKAIEADLDMIDWIVGMLAGL